MSPLTGPQTFALALDHHRAGRVAQAEGLYLELLKTQPGHPELLHLLGLVARQTGRAAVGREWVRCALAAQPGEARYHCTLGFILNDLGECAEAAASFEAAIGLKADYADAHFGLGLARMRQQQAQAASEAYREVVRFDPGHADAWLNLGILLAEGGEADAASEAFETVLRLQPEDVLALNNLGNLWRGQGRCAAALDCFRRALAREPQRAEVRSNLIYTLYFQPGTTAAEIEREQQAWDRQHAVPAVAHGNERTPGRRLRVGYVSPDFRDHVVGRNVWPLLREHERAGFEVVCFSDVLQPDALTERFRARAEGWHETAGLSHEELAALIQRERIDVLVDLTQHLARNRLPVFARQPAPVQVSFAGYPGGAGLAAIDYHLSDPYLTPAGSDDARVFRLESFWCFDPLDGEAAVQPPPALEVGYITFGCLNDPSKVNERVLELWSRVLREVAGSRLLLLSAGEHWRERTLAFLAECGVERERVEFTARLPRPAYLALHQRVDVILDTFPYNGHTTTCDALWLGVPVVSLAGELPVSRGGLSILSNVGLPELVAQTEDDYVRIAAELARDLPRLARLRAGLRTRMKASPLMDAPRFTRNIEAAYREMWRRWCAPSLLA